MSDREKAEGLADADWSPSWVCTHCGKCERTGTKDCACGYMRYDVNEKPRAMAALIREQAEELSEHESRISFLLVQHEDFRNIIDHLRAALAAKDAEIERLQGGLKIIAYAPECHDGCYAVARAALSEKESQ